MNQSTDMKVIAKALEFASKKHVSQRRKNGDIPYINHPIEVFNILCKAEIIDTNTLCAALLHDTVEDTDTTPEQLQKQFNSQITKIVLECSDDKALAKDQRKRVQIQHAKHVTYEAKLVKIADKLSNNWDMFYKPPPAWSTERIKGYHIWSLVVCQNLKGVNEILDNEMDKIFKKVQIADLSEEVLKVKLEEYLQILKS